jgi:hypothetical protein
MHSRILWNLAFMFARYHDSPKLCRLLVFRGSSEQVVVCVNA